ncbi:MAG: hypothetical protein UU08_C0003G0001 [Candidatus Uhrbacteria bacterium GW2011_GWE2_40_58]|nr:MAG: hypothetical protein UT94_C0004G0001 [Candidatus Uhrbacteria bacterium GW2011_GWF2_40_263]KKR68078.1 MAG: hypothetical protein UU08_C0003G0001 [Candidatus Uhrbacteria bacterium GW2011_GWE2_40_58]OGL97229.1 MAG: hypothetical protein A2332_01415 [Candidatus Uhrbacteria bacterium RIFOXYB2_FULL_41_18]
MSTARAIKQANRPAPSPVLVSLPICTPILVLDETPPTASRTLEAKIDDEIALHGISWCKHPCVTFSADRYRYWRRRGRTFEKMKRLHDCCHVGDDD